MTVVKDRVSADHDLRRCDSHRIVRTSRRPLDCHHKNCRRDHDRDSLEYDRKCCRWSDRASMAEVGVSSSAMAHAHAHALRLACQ